MVRVLLRTDEEGYSRRCSRSEEIHQDWLLLQGNPGALQYRSHVRPGQLVLPSHPPQQPGVLWLHHREHGPRGPGNQQPLCSCPGCAIREGAKN